jgi:hypothetical protein
MTTQIRFLPVIFLMALISACSATNRLSMTVTEPAQVHMPPEVRRVGIIDRSVPGEGQAGLAKIDAILTAEGMKLDQEGARAAVAGLADRLRVSNRFEAVVVLDSLPEVAKGLKGMPAPLSREVLKQICGEYGLDALFSLSFYDTDTRVQLELIMMDIPNTFGVSVKVPGHKVDLTTSLRSGWRMYMPQVPLPMDQWEYTDYIRVSGQGINPVDAYNSIAYRKEQVMEQSHQTGYSHGGRLEPKRIRVGRDYFVRGSDAFSKARRLAQTGAWDAAARLWETEVDHPKEKIAGRAHYNMAIINEINGNLPEAIDWARESYATFGTREALRYLRVLERRQAQQQELDAQLSQLEW